MSQAVEAPHVPVIQPGSLLAILGGGQLGRMVAMAARSMGYRVRVLDPDAHCPASLVADEVIAARWDDAAAATRLATGAAAVTLEIEQIGIDALATVAGIAPLRPGVAPIAIIQDKILQKTWLQEQGFPVGPFSVVYDETALAEVVSELGGRVFLKAARGGYDGRGQARIGFDRPATSASLTQAWASIGAKPSIAEQALDLDFEISVLAARSPSGEVRCYPAARNHHANQILAWSVIPAGIPAALEQQAQSIATEIITRLGIEGLLCVEFFVTRADSQQDPQTASDSRPAQLLVNELAPRPHNSYHHTERACATSQFEQAVRATCNLPLGETGVLVPAAIVNLFGEDWSDAIPAGPQPSTNPPYQPNFAAALAVPGVRLHLYEKREPRPGRKMGHLSATGSSTEQALERVLKAKSLLSQPE